MDEREPHSCARPGSTSRELARFPFLSERSPLPVCLRSREPVIKPQGRARPTTPVSGERGRCRLLIPALKPDRIRVQSFEIGEIHWIQKTKQRFVKRRCGLSTVGYPSKNKSNASCARKSVARMHHENVRASGSGERRMKRMDSNPFRVALGRNRNALDKLR